MLQKLVIVVCLGCLLASCSEEITPPEKPNIIFILTDDQRFDSLGYAGNDIIHTPEMDKLAEQGVYFENALVTTPICSANIKGMTRGRSLAWVPSRR